MGQVLESAADIDTAILRMVKNWANDRSKDPNKKVGAAVYSTKTKDIYLGYNGFAPGFPDNEEYWRKSNDYLLWTKYNFVIHAEANAIRKALVAGADLSDCVLYCSLIPCPRCINECVAATGIKKVVYLSNESRSVTDKDRLLIVFICDTMGIELVHHTEEIC